MFWAYIELCFGKYIYVCMCVCVHTGAKYVQTGTKYKRLCISCNSVCQFSNTAICAAVNISLLCFVLTVIVVG